VPDVDPDGLGRGYGVWSIAGARLESFSPQPCTIHVVYSWKVAQKLVLEAFEDQSSLGETSEVNLGNGGYYQKRYFDGLATHIELL